jgi:hypothetical protein
MHTMQRTMRVAFGVAMGATIAVASAGAQDMEPKAYSASPVGANFLVAVYSSSTGGVVIDPTLPVTDVHATVRGLAVATGHTFNLFGDLALATVALPYAWADLSGKVQEQAAAVSRSGLADARLKLSVNLRGNPAMSAREFARAPRKAVIGASLSVSAPAGQYYDTKLVNLGTNRWSFKPEVGISLPIRRLDADAYFGAWFFTANDDFYPGGLKRTQDPMVAFQGHLSYSFKPRLWLAADSTWYSGGGARVSDGELSTGVNNSRLGLTVSMPVGAKSSLKVAYGTGVVVRTGSNFDTLAVAWQTLWLSPR